MDGGLLFLLFAVFAVGVAVLSITWAHDRSKKLIAGWARNNGYRLVSVERRFLRRGPFFFWTSDNQTVFRVVLEDEDGVRATGFARCGSWWLGLWSDRVEVSLDRPEPGVERVFE